MIRGAPKGAPFLYLNYDLFDFLMDYDLLRLFIVFI